MKLGLEDRVHEEIDHLRILAGRAHPESLRDGRWLAPTLRDALDEWAVEVTLPRLREQHPGLELDELADARITNAQRLAMMAGGLSAGAFASVVMGTLALGGLTTALALPSALTAFAVDLYYTARTQLRLGYELAVIYERPVELSDDAQLLDLAHISFGMEPDKDWTTFAVGMAPEASRFGTRALTAVGRITYQQAMSVLGRKLVERGIAKFAVPAVGVPLCAGVNHVTTGIAGRRAKQVLRAHATAREAAADLADEPTDVALLTLQALLLVIRADERVKGAEAELVEQLARLVDDSGLAEQRAALEMSEEQLLEQLEQASPEVRPAVYRAAIGAAALDGVLHSEEDRLLRRLATACDVDFDPREISAAIMRFREGTSTVPNR